MAENPDPNNLLPTRGELVWKSMFAGSAEERDAAKQLMEFGLFYNDSEHAMTTDHRLDPNGTKVFASPSGKIIQSLIDAQPDEGPGADEPEPPIVGGGNPTATPLVPIPSTEELGLSMQKLQGLAAKAPPEPPKPKYYVAPPPSEPSRDLQPIDWESFDNNEPL